MQRGLTPCHGVAAIQYALALGALALGHIEVAGAFLVFALAQTFTLVVQRCGWAGGACETAAPDRATTPRPVP